MEATISIFTYRGGLLARLAHDLQFSVRQHEFTVKGRHVQGFCAASSLVVVGVMTDTGLDRRVLSFNDRQMISDAVRNVVLQSDTYPRIEFEGDIVGEPSGTLRLIGQLHVRGASHMISSELTVLGDRLQSTLELKPSDFGIKPFKALGGAIKLRDHVRITLEVYLEGRSVDSVLADAKPIQLMQGD